MRKRRNLKIRGLLKGFISPAWILLLFSGSCKNYLCENHQILTAFKFYEASEIDSFVLKKFQPTNTFDQLIDSTLVINSAVNSSNGNAVFTQYNDTTIVVAVNDNNPNSGIVPGYDWQIFIPSRNETFRISEIYNPQLDGVEPCDNALLSYLQKSPKGSSDTSIIVNSPFYSASDDPMTTGYLIYINHLQ